MNNSCVTCNEKVTSAKPGLQCMGACTNWYHLKCAKVKTSTLKLIKEGECDWACTSCKKRNVKKPSIVIDEDISPRSPPCSPFSVPVDIGNAVTALQRDVKLILTTMQNNQQQLQEMREQQKEILKSLQFEMERGDDLENKVKVLEVQLQEANEERAELRKMASEMRYKFDSIEQESYATQLEIQGAPLGLSTGEVVMKLCAHVSCPLAASDIEWSRRLPAPRATRDESGSQSARVPAVIVRLTTEETKERILKACRAKQPLKTVDLDPSVGTACATRIYVNEQLSFQRKMLLHETKRFAKTNNYKYVWTKKGNVLLKKEDGGKVYYIKTTNDISKINKKE